MTEQMILKQLPNQENDFSTYAFDGTVDPLTRMLEQSAAEIGLTCIRHKKNVLEFKSNSRSIVFDQGLFHGSIIGSHITSRWLLTKKILRQHQFNVPDGWFCQDLQTAVNHLKKSSFPLHFRPLRDPKHKHCFTSIKDENHLKQQWQLLNNKQRGLVLEPYINGHCIKVIAIGSKFLCAYISIEAFISGNSRDSLKYLLRQKNILRKKNPRSPAIIRYLKNHLKSDIDLNYIPDNNEIIKISRINHQQPIQDYAVINDILHPSIISMTQQINPALPALNLSEITLIVDNPSKALDSQNVNIVDVNPAPAFIHPIFAKQTEHLSEKSHLISFDMYDCFNFSL